ncbi:MAG: isovaleryl-CoA dehydrogenase [Planctomycetaceae bacterium]|nr:isovaleryl-CoA dehydrogenase [Planctomycetaceae bacterium]
MLDRKESVEIRTPDDPALIDLCRQLHELSGSLDFRDATGNYPWPQKQLELCAQYGVFRWFLEPEYGGFGWNDHDLTLGYLALSAACQTTTFVITQRTGACRRIALSGNDFAREQLIPALLDGSRFSTVGISHLTTSRRHLRQAVLRAEETKSGFILNGFSPWVTGAIHADTIVAGAQLDDGRQILTVVPTELPGIQAESPADLVALSASHTGKVSLVDVEVDRQWLLAGPIENVMAQGIGARTGGLQTSTLAIGLTGAAIDFIFTESKNRSDLLPPAEALNEEREALKTILLQSALGAETCGTEELRQRCNSLVLRSTQAALSAAKGMGFVAGHPVGRWCREALFFMVWSCPQPVVNAQMCQLAGIATE